MTSLAALVDLSWLMALLQEKPKFHQSCPCQPSTRQQSFFCKDCMLGFLFCESCKNYTLDHKGHQVLQVFKFTYQKLGIRISIIEDMFYLSDIEYDYIQNLGQIVYIDRKMQGKQYENSIENSISSKIGYKSSKECEACGCELQSSTSKYCSIECKVEKETNSIITSYEEEAADGTSKQETDQKNPRAPSSPKFPFS